MALIWDERKRQANIVKHGLDFADAHLVYENPEKLTFSSTRSGEPRNLDIAPVKIAGRPLVLIYTVRGEDVRVISYRVASRREREIYDRRQKSD